MRKSLDAIFWEKVQIPKDDEDCWDLGQVSQKENVQRSIEALDFG